MCQLPRDWNYLSSWEQDDFKREHSWELSYRYDQEREAERLFNQKEEDSYYECRRQHEREEQAAYERERQAREYRMYEQMQEEEYYASQYADQYPYTHPQEPEPPPEAPAHD